MVSDCKHDILTLENMSFVLAYLKQSVFDVERIEKRLKTMEILIKERDELFSKIEQLGSENAELLRKHEELEQKLKESEFNRNFWFDKHQAQEEQNAVLLEALKKEMVLHCHHFENRKNHSTICCPPDDEECRHYYDCMRVEGVLEQTPAESAAKVLKSQIHLYNLGYMAGHEDTVEGVFTSLSAREMETENEDVVKQALAEWEDTK